MPAELALLHPPAELWRVERTDPPLRFSRINPGDALADRAGNRFDVVGAGVLYGATSPVGAFTETLAAFRPSASLARKLAQRQSDPGVIGQGEVPRQWRLDRRLRSFQAIDPLPFVDIEAPTSHTFLTQNASEVLLERDVSNLDVTTVRGPSRLLTRGLARWLYTSTDEVGDALYGGIRYVSRLGDFECWAIFDGTSVELRSEAAIELTQPALLAVADTYRIHLY